MTTSHLRRTLVAVSTATVLALAGCGGDDPEAQATNTSESPTASQSPSTSGSKTPEPKKSSEPPAPERRALEIAVAGGEVSPTAQSLELGVGEELLIIVDSDRSGELHVHSTPEQMVAFETGLTRQVLTFDKPGSVDIEEHESGALIARVLVQ